MARTVAILVADGIADSGLAVALDILRAANAICARQGKLPVFDPYVASPKGGRVRAASGLTIDGTKPAIRAAGAHFVLVPGLWVETPADLDRVLARDDLEPNLRAIARAHARGAVIGSSCSGAFQLAKTGILDGRRATTTWWLAGELRRRFTAIDVIEGEALIVDDRIITAGAVFAVADLALNLVARWVGPGVARETARVLLLDRHASQASYMALRFTATDDPIVRKAETWARAHLDEAFDMGTLARKAGASQRTLARRLEEAVGTSPIGFVQRLRVETAIHLLETSRLSIDEISARVGYADAETLRRLVRRETGLAPREIRRRITAGP
ncbi:MAG TPA: helix-turn-helix domain-containing protein [Kofleriaceae bacterium]|nr:helix-turn-helix domain-containing protein [Kofleriaceae bacterium]